MVVDLVSAYPAIVLGLVAAYLAGRRGWRLGPILAVGAIAFAALVLHQSTVPRHANPEGTTFTPAIWALFATVNAASWALGIAMGVAVAGLRRHPHPG